MTKAEWVAKETALWHKLMDPRTLHAEGWRVYQEWIKH